MADCVRRSHLTVALIRVLGLLFLLFEMETYLVRDRFPELVAGAAPPYSLLGMAYA